MRTWNRYSIIKKWFEETPTILPHELDYSHPSLQLTETTLNPNFPATIQLHISTKIIAPLSIANLTFSSLLFPHLFSAFTSLTQKSDWFFTVKKNSDNIIWYRLFLIHKHHQFTKELFPKSDNYGDYHVNFSSHHLTKKLQQRSTLETRVS